MGIAPLASSEAVGGAHRPDGPLLDCTSLTRRFGDLTRLAGACRAIPGVEQVAIAADRIHLVTTDGRRALPAVLEAAQRTSVAITSVEIADPDLEAVFPGEAW